MDGNEPAPAGMRLRRLAWRLYIVSLLAAFATIAVAAAVGQASAHAGLPIVLFGAVAAMGIAAAATLCLLASLLLAGRQR